MIRIEFKNSFYYWWMQRVSAIALLLISPWFFYSFFYAFYIAEDSFSFNMKLLHAIKHPIELLFFTVLLFYIFWHAILGMRVICMDYIHNPFLRIFTIAFIRYFSGITYLSLIFTVFYFYRHIFFSIS